MGKITAVLAIGICLVVFAAAGPARATEVLQAKEFQVTFDVDGHSLPMIGHDSIGDLIVYFQYPVVNGTVGNASLYYQRVANGAPTGAPVTVADSPENQWLPDVSGDYIVYTLSPNVGQLGNIELYQISTSQSRPLTSSGRAWSPMIYGDVVVWIEVTPSGAGQVAMYQIHSGVPVMSTLMAGPFPPVSQAAVGDRFIVWSQDVNNQFDLAAYDMQKGLSFMVANDPALNEMAPSTEGAWIAFETQSVTAPAGVAIKAINIDTGEQRTIADNGASNIRPIISGNLISYESNVSGKPQIYVYRIQQGDTFKVTSGMYNEQLNNLKGNLVTYVDNRNGNDGVFASYLTFVSPRPSFVSTVNNMTSVRGDHTATLLPNGTVLIAGGSNGPSCLNTAEIYDPSAGTFTATGNMTSARYRHTATLLPNGTVLIAGGYDGITRLNTAEIYDPSAGTFTATGNMTSVRYQHTATLLPNGKVLIAGGNVGTAEIYDPSTRTFTATGNMTSARYRHTATLLPNGKVLIAGGFGCNVGTAEIYDPSTGTFTAIGNIIFGRMEHTATLLPNGKVLIAGGFGGDNCITCLNTAEIYDPSAGTFTATGKMTSGRAYHGATLLPNGKVLIAGGRKDNTPTGTLNTAEIYDPSTGTFTATGNMTSARESYTATLLPNGTVLIAGGNGSTVGTAEIYDPSAGTFTATGNMTSARGIHTATLLPNGTVLIAGGVNSTTVLNTAGIYDPSVGTFTATGNMTSARGIHTATLLPNGTVLIAGGFGGDNGTTYLNTAEIYDPSAGTFTATGNMTSARGIHTATLLRNGTVLIAGGDNGTTYLNTAEIYDPSAGTFTGTGNMTSVRTGHTATLLPNGTVLIAGGFGGDNGTTYLNTAEIYDPSAGTFTGTGNMTSVRTGHTATLLPNGTVLIAGGNGSTVGTAEIYDPSTGTFTATGNMTSARGIHTATLLRNGAVLIAGGDNGTTYLYTAEIYDPSAGTFTGTGKMTSVRMAHTATLLPNGKVLIAGGNGPTCLNTAEIYDHLGYGRYWQPELNTVTSPLPLGSAFHAGGLGFTGNNTEASSGGTNNSATNYPLVQLQSIANEQVMWLIPDPSMPFTGTTFASLPIDNFAPGYALATVYVNGSPSLSQIIQVVGAAYNAYTPSEDGDSVTVSPPGSETVITFSTVSSPGYTSVTPSSSGPAPPSGFKLLGNYYNITTTATYTPPVTVCITNPAVTATSQLLHYESDLRNVTITPVIPPTICGQVNSLSPFVIAQSVNHPPVALCQNVTVPAGSNCTAPASINNGSYDPDAGDAITLTQLPAGPYQKGTTSVTLTVTDSQGASSQCTGTVTVTDNTPPSITAPAGVTAYTGVGATSCGTVVNDGVLGTATASDNCPGVTVSRNGVPTGNLFPVGTTTVTYTATDTSNNMKVATQTVTVIDNTQPTLNLPADFTVPMDRGQCSAVVNYTVTAGDNCTGVTLTSNPQSGSNFQKGTTTVNVTATDAARNTAAGSFKVTVADKENPTVSNLSATPSTLWPPNHKMVNVTINYNATDNCPGQPVCQISSVTSNEPIGSSDYTIVDAHHVNLTADRLGSGNGRIYTITVTCTDASNNSSSQVVTVSVPHDQGK